ncbi:MAG TPA: NYN domain-containing protein [Streptosporangiaceae bacterium]|nr:NYN domain-containing protein [Streptosporangiaceae bacterium]
MISPGRPRLLGQAPDTSGSGTAGIHIFWDQSNLFVPLRFIASRREGRLEERGIRLHFPNLYRLARAGRTVAKAVCVGSIPPDLGRLWDRISDLGVTVEVQERGAQSNTEQGVDAALQLHMLHSLTDSPPSVAVLLTGDGAGYDQGRGFLADLERMAKGGWAVEVLSWRAACAQHLRRFAEEQGIFVALDDYYEAITFLADGRRVAPLSLKHRALARAS